MSTGDPGDRVRPWHDEKLRGVIAACVTLGFAVGVYGISFGVASIGSGATIAQTCVISLLVFTGASQFSAVGVLADGGTPLAAFGGAAVLAARNGVYGFAMASRLDGGLATRMLAAQWTIDETTAMAAAQDDRRHGQWAFWITGASVYVFWNAGTLIGALIGSAIDPETFGLDAAFPAAFVAMLWPLLRERRHLRAAAVGALVCLVLTPFTPVGVPILCATAGIAMGLREDDDR
ncbi:MAG: AzlC family ABC transporter permease [Ilumatobacteraceae bacterium]|jgi:4-azaleucine resistance transporter AzlC